MSGRATVIFDFDGTLANTVDLVVRLYNEHSDEFGYQEIEQSEFPMLRRMGYKKAMKLKGIRYGAVPKMLLKIGREMRQHMGEVEPYDGVVEVLEKLRSDGFSIGVLTSNNAALVKDFFNRHSFPKFDFIVSEKTYFGKEKALKRIMKRFELRKEQVLYIGDEPRDVTACHKAGIQVIAVTWGIGGEESFEKNIPSELVRSPQELLDTIEKLSQE